MFIKAIVVFLLLIVIASLGSALFYLLTDRGEGRRTVKALTARIALSIAAFLLLLIGYAAGLIQPHGISP